MFALLYKYVPSGTKGEFSYKVRLAIECNDSDLMKKLLLWNYFVGAFSRECSEYLSFARDIMTLIMKKRNARMLSVILEHDPFPEILRSQVDLRVTNAANQTFLYTVFNPSVEQQNIIKILSLFLDHGFNDARMKNGYTPLCLAVKYGMVDVAKFLIDAGANVHVRCSLEGSLINMLLMDELASSRGRADTNEFMKETNAELMKLLLSAGIRIDLKCCNGVTPLTFIVINNLLYFLPLLQEHARAVNFEDSMERSIFELYLDAVPVITQEWDSKLYEAKSRAFKLLLKDCSNVNVCNNQGNTPLHAIIDHYEDGNAFRYEKSYLNVNGNNEAMYEEMIDLLLSKGADIHRKNSEGMTPVHLTAKYKHINLLLVFQEHGADFNESTDSGDNMLHLVAKHRTHVNENINRVVTEFLIVNGCDLNACNNEGITPLLYALKMNNSSIIAETLIEYGADVNCSDQFGSTPLHAAIQLDYDKVVPLLIKRGAELDRKHLKSQLTPLHLAVKRNRVDVVERLIKAGANVRIRGENGRTALHLAAFCNSSNSVITLLLEAGVSVNLKDNDGYTILRDIVEYNNTAGFESMIKYNFDLNKIDASRDIFSIPNFETKEVWNVIVKHLLKRKAINLYISDIYNPYVCSLNQKLQGYFEEFFKEVQSLKRKEAIDQISFYDLLRMNPKKRFSCVKKEAFKIRIRNYEKFSFEFPEYASLIYASYFEAVAIEERIRLEKSVSEVWYELTKIYLDDICVERIISYVDSYTLELIDREYKNSNCTETHS